MLLDESRDTYDDVVMRRIQDVAAHSESRDLLDRPGGIFIRRAVDCSEAERVLLRTSARCEFVGQRGSLAEQISERERRIPSADVPVRREADIDSNYLFDDDPSLDRCDSHACNGCGGMNRDGREYVIVLEDGNPTGHHGSNGNGSVAHRQVRSRAAVTTPAPWATWLPILVSALLCLKAAHVAPGRSIARETG